MREVDELEVVLLREALRDRDAARPAVLDDDLAEPAAGGLAFPERLLELARRDQPVAQQEDPERQPARRRLERRRGGELRSLHRAVYRSYALVT